MQPLLLRTGTEAQGCETGGSLFLQQSFVRTQLCMSAAAVFLVFVDGRKLAASHIQGSEVLQVGKAMLVKLAHKYFTHLEDDGKFAMYAIGIAIAMPFWASAVCQGLVGADSVVSDQIRASCGIVQKATWSGCIHQCGWLS